MGSLGTLTKCDHKGCKRQNLNGIGDTMFTTDKGTFCAEHFTSARHSTPLAPAKITKGKRNASGK